MEQLPNCPKCNSEYTYEDGVMLVCPECAHEWVPGSEVEAEDVKVVKGANGNVLQDGDSVTVIKDLKVKGSSLVVKIGTKVKNIRLVDGDHDIDCKIDGVRLPPSVFRMFGRMSGQKRPAVFDYQTEKYSVCYSKTAGLFCSS